MRVLMCVLVLFGLVTTAPALGAEMRIVFWFDRGRPLDTFKFQAYDLRKNEFTPDVERWLTRMKGDFPGYEAYARDVDLSRERGETEKLKLGSAILREFYILGARQGYTFGGDVGVRPGHPSGVNDVGRSGAFRALPRVGSPAPSTFMPAASSPFPVPYPRPHP